MFYILFILSLVLGGILLLVYVMRHVMFGDSGTTLFKKMRIQPKSLRILESLMIDPKRRVVLLKHNDDGYLLLLGQSNETILKGPFPILRDPTSECLNVFESESVIP